MTSVFSATMPLGSLNVTVTVRLPELSSILYVALYLLVGSVISPFVTVTYRVMSAPSVTSGKSTGSTHWDKVSVMEKILIFADEVMVE